MSYAGEWLPTRLTCGRLRILPSKALCEQFEKQLRKGAKISPQKPLSRIARGEHNMEIESHRVFWDHDAWRLDIPSHVDFACPAQWSDQAFAERLALFSDHRHLRRYLRCYWGFPPSLTHQGLVSVSVDIEAHHLNDAENPVHFRTSPGFDLASEPAINASNCDLSRALAVAFGLQECIVEQPTENLKGFDLVDPLKPKNFFAPHTFFQSREARGNVEFPFPYTITLGTCPSSDEAIPYVQKAVELMTKVKGPPSLVQFFFRASAPGIVPYIEACRSIKPVWDNWKFFAKYKKGFDPFAHQKDLPKGEVRVYPLLQYANDHLDNTFEADKLFVRASVVHTKDESFIELQTSEGQPWLEKAAEYAGCEIDIWEGPLEKRWGLYA